MTAELVPIRTGSVALGGMTLAFRECGEPDGLPVLLLHALGSEASTWDGFAAALAEAGRYAIALDLRGHGASSRPGEYSFELMVDDVAAFLDDRGLDRVDLVGHSMGGHVAWLLARQRPAQVRRLVVEDAPPPPRDDTSAGDGIPEPPAEPPEPMPFDWAVVRPVFRRVRTPDPVWWSSGLRDTTMPTLLISGGPTSHIAPSRLEDAAAGMPDARLVVIDVGHHVHRERPVEFAQTVIPFLAGR